jgi:monoterpene epsilon-lactone hydrolase
MSSLSSRLMRLMIKYVVAPPYRRAGMSIVEWRKLMQPYIKFQRLPAGTDVQSTSVSGTAADWVCAPSARTDRAILFLHGGACVMGSPGTHRELAARLSLAARARVLLLDYRLAPEHPFPAAMQDAISAYGWLLDQGYTAERIAVGGDSAGGGLALQTLIALRNEGRTLPPAAFFLSPVTDWVRFDGESFSTRATSDPWITLDMCKFTSALYIGPNDPAAPLLYPTGMDLSGLPPMCIHVGEDEVLLSDSTRLAERARACQVPAELVVWPGLWHDFQMMASLVPEGQRSLDEIGRFVGQRIGSM